MEALCRGHVHFYTVVAMPQGHSSGSPPVSYRYGMMRKEFHRIKIEIISIYRSNGQLAWHYSQELILHYVFHYNQARSPFNAIFLYVTKPFWLWRNLGWELEEVLRCCTIAFRFSMSMFECKLFNFSRPGFCIYKINKRFDGYFGVHLCTLSPLLTA